MLCIFPIFYFCCVVFLFHREIKCTKERGWSVKEKVHETSPVSDYRLTRSISMSGWLANLHPFMQIEYVISRLLHFICGDFPFLISIMSAQLYNYISARASPFFSWQWVYERINRVLLLADQPWQMKGGYLSCRYCSLNKAVVFFRISYTLWPLVTRLELFMRGQCSYTLGLAMILSKVHFFSVQIVLVRE